MMKDIMFITFVFLAASGLKTVMLLETAGCIEEVQSDNDCFTIPTFDTPDFNIPFEATWNPDFVKIGGVDFVADAIGNLGAVFVEIGEFVIAAVKWIFSLLIEAGKTILLIVNFALFLLGVLFTGLPGAPWFIDLIIILPFVIGILAVFVLIVSRQASGS